MCRTCAQLDLVPHGVVEEAVDASEVFPKSLEHAARLKPKAKSKHTFARIKGVLYAEAIAALEVEPNVTAISPKFTPMGFSSVPMGTDRPQQNTGDNTTSVIRQEALDQAQMLSTQSLQQLAKSGVAS